MEGSFGTRLQSYLWLVGNGRMVVIVVIIVPHSCIPYYPKVSNPGAVKHHQIHLRNPGNGSSGKGQSVINEPPLAAN